MNEELDRLIIKEIVKKYGKDAFFGKRILDLSCGNANVAAALARLGGSCLIVGDNPGLLKETREKYPHLETKEVDLNKDLPFNERFDFALCLNYGAFNSVVQNAASIANNLIIESNDLTLLDKVEAKDIIFTRQNYEFKKSWRKIWFGESKLFIKPIEEVKLSSPVMPEFVYDDKQRISILPTTLPEKISIPTKPRIALCLSGHLRTFERTHSSMMVNLIDALEADVFIHTWDTLGSSTSKNNSDVNTAWEPTIDKLEAIYKCYSPKKILIEKFDKDKFIEMAADVVVPEKDIQYISFNLGYHFAMFYGIEQVNNLRKSFQASSGFEYDYIVRFRPDLTLKTRIDRSFLPQQRGVINVPVIGQYCPEGMNDQFALGFASDMDIYCDMINSIKEYCQKRVTTIRPEALLQYHCTKNNLLVHRKNINYEISRVNYAKATI